MREYDLLVGGESPSAAEQTTVKDPASNQPVSHVTRADETDVAFAVESASEAFETWREVDPTTRSQYLMDIAEGLRDKQDHIAQRHTEETGRSVTDSKRSVEFAAEYFEYYAGLTHQIKGETVPLSTGEFDFTKCEPLGVTGHIIPWNSPLLLASRSIAPALACGNTVVAKPAELAPMAVMELGKVAHDAGLPDGVLNMVPGEGTIAGEALVTDKRVNELTFTGSKEVGFHIRETVSDRLIPLNLELGGKSPNIVFDDADLEAAAEGAVKLFNNAGQSCYAGTRLFVADEIYDAFIERVVDRIERMTVAKDPNETDVSALISPSAQSEVDAYVESALEAGATVTTGGCIPFEDGNFYEPTLIEDAPDDAAVSCEEIFGPVLTAYRFESEREVVERANDTEYGLYAGVWTTDLERANRIAGHIEAGTVTVNNYASPIPQAPFPAYKQSGAGSEYATAALRHYTKVKNVRMAVDKTLR
ncbi:aldehyde dehydrogenase [Natronococcus sp. JC468]|uniref:aldehyde dehydrogenase family protein n=1 Tax=Natronococcus sp. JC468 TaxID=1961921 RepID=UPI00143C20ED|nr:aldehyde dehydrogenase family protein [Natronococcus sp. JC468]NKE37258.1 aldehyde dehydrogenase [Natronococcus sp. JC468]